MGYGMIQLEHHFSTYIGHALCSSALNGLCLLFWFISNTLHISFIESLRAFYYLRKQPCFSFLKYVNSHETCSFCINCGLDGRKNTSRKLTFFKKQQAVSVFVEFMG